ncbi:hypothetical protein KXQ82_07120 [Mucilaginibacter sp. HMF5004]|uniref:hypothetical protein n=1 Tax=Mucilaginibacter rivuli TaxID=2857527 RepID=UPI001C5ED3BD|nr:hypothetical protein [Mucilaginibacter rivuli]MBW4889478.1 hypothetical protein [Mucilaginibacter rivuli]
MKKATFTLLATIAAISAAFAQNVDSLQKKQDSIQHICAKADLYINTADSLIQFNQDKTRLISIADAAKAGELVLKAIQINKAFNDTVAVRNNFDRLGQAYVMQNKFTQAKWYILQSNRISRDRHDIAHIISGLMQLAAVKISIKDYSLAEKDLLEAVVLTKYSYNIIAQIEAERKLAALYDKSGKIKEAKSMLAHYTLLADNYKKAHTPQIIAMQKAIAKVKTRPATAQPKQDANTQAEMVESHLNIENGIWGIKN